MGGERLGQGCCQVLTASEAFRIIQETVAPGSPGGMVGLRSESLRSARKGGFQLEEAAEGGGGDGVGGSRTSFPPQRLGSWWERDKSGSFRMEEMRASPGERAGMAGTLQIPTPSFCFLHGHGGRERSTTFKTSHTHTHTHKHTHSDSHGPSLQSSPAVFLATLAAEVGLSFSAGALFLLPFLCLLFSYFSTRNHQEGPI